MNKVQIWCRRILMVIGLLMYFYELLNLVGIIDMIVYYANKIY